MGQQLELVYDGDAVRSGVMDVNELAPALLSFGDMVREANRILNGGQSEVSVYVRSDFKRGSFGVTVEIVQTLAALKDLFSGNVRDEVQLLLVLGLLEVGRELGVFQLFKIFRGRPAQPKTRLANGNVVMR
jgi:hypothetical protein